MPSLNESKEILIKFLSFPLESADSVFDCFARIPGANYIKGNKEQERFLYIPGTRKDRVLLVAHADTVWDYQYKGKEFKQEIEVLWPIIKGTNPASGIGADDRAGCAMLYALKDCGHSILIMDAEEHYKTSHNFLKKKHRKLFKELNGHQYMLEIDLPKSGYCSSSRIPNTKAFERYIESSLNLQSSPAMERLGTDITQLCKKVCGINVSCSYEKHHTFNESINGDKWYETLCMLEAFLKAPQKKYKISRIRKIKMFLVRAKNGVIKRARNIVCKQTILQ